MHQISKNFKLFHLSSGKRTYKIYNLYRQLGKNFKACYNSDDDGPAKIQHPVEMRAAELLPLQHELQHQQLVIFSPQLQLIEEQ